MTVKTTKSENKVNGKTIKVTLERGTWEEEINLDGFVCGSKTHLVDRLEITLLDGNKRVDSGSKIDEMKNYTRHPNYNAAIKAGCVGLIGNKWFVKAETVEIINEMIKNVEKDNPITGEMIAIKNEEMKKEMIARKNLEEIEKMDRNREKHAGWCKICEDWTYGDCGH